jgi:amino acid transporter
MATQVAEQPLPIARPTDLGFKREMGLIGATWASETSIIGSGWLFGALYASQAAGPLALLGWVIGGVAIIILALVHAELGAMFPVAGGTARFPHFAFGSVSGISFGFFSWLQAVTVAPIEVYAVFQYLSYYWPAVYDAKTGVVTATGFAMTILLLILLTALNFAAMRLFNRINAGITWWKVAIPVVTIIVLLFHFHGGNFSAGGGFFHSGWKALFSAIPSAGIVFAYLGFEQADQLAAEVKDPQRNLPRAIILSIFIGTVIYMMLQVVFIAAMPHSQIAHGFANISNKGILSYPFAGLTALIGLGALATILHIDAVISPGGTGLMYLTSTSRIGYGLGRNHYYPQPMTWVDKRGIPWISLIVGFLLGLVFLLPFPSWHDLVSLVTGASVLMYAGAPLSMGAFRNRLPEFERPYRMPGAAVLGPLAFIVATMLIYWSGFMVVWKLGACIGIGYLLIGGFMAFDKQRPKLEWSSSLWLPVYLVGLGIISWQGQYSGVSGKALPPTNTGNIPFWWDMLTVAVFSLVIYFWAVHSALPEERISELVEAQSARTEEIEGNPNLTL